MGRRATPLFAVLVVPVPGVFSVFPDELLAIPVWTRVAVTVAWSVLVFFAASSAASQGDRPDEPPGAVPEVFPMPALPIAGLRAVALAVILIAVAACSTTAATPSPSSAAIPSAATSTLCADVAALRTSIQALKSIDLIAGGTDGLKTAVDGVRTAAAALQASATAELAPDVAALVTAIDGLKTAVGKVGTGSIGENLVPIKAAIESVSTAWDRLQAKVTTPCPS